MEEVVDQISDGVSQTVHQLTNFGRGAFQVVVVVLLAQLANRTLRRIARRRLERDDVPLQVRVFIQNGITIGCFLAATTLLLALWGITWSAILTAVGVGTLAIVLGLADILRSLVGGLFIVTEKPYAIGDRVTVRTVTGEVADINLRTTVLRSDEGNRITVPNALIFTDPVENLNALRMVTAIIVMTEVPGDPDETRKTITRVLASVPHVPKEIDIEVRMQGNMRTLLTDSLGSIRREIHRRRTKSAREEFNCRIVIRWRMLDDPGVRTAAAEALSDAFPDATVRTSRRLV